MEWIGILWRGGGSSEWISGRVCVCVLRGGEGGYDWMSKHMQNCIYKDSIKMMFQTISNTKGLYSLFPLDQNLF